MNVSFYLRIENKQKAAIYSQISYKGYQTKYYIGEHIHPDLWDKSAQRAKKVRKNPIYAEFNARLESIDATIRRLALHYANENGNKYPTPAILHTLLDGSGIRDGKKKEPVTFLSFFSDFITRCENGTRLFNGKPLSEGTLRSYRTTKKCLETYQTATNKTVNFNTIDLAFYNHYKNYLSKKLEQSTNTIGKNIKIIKTVLNDATVLGVNKNLAYKSGFTKLTENTDSIYLTETELAELSTIKISSSLESVRDLFIVGCYTGLRFSDLSTLQPSQISANGMITVTQTKTGNPVMIPVHSAVSKIIEKYNGNLPAAISNQKTNDALKLIAQACPLLQKKHGASFTKGGVKVSKGSNKQQAPEKWELVTTHTARRSFCTNMYLSGMPTITIMAISGHKTESAFMKYIKVAPIEHANIIKKFWAEQKPGNTIAI